MKFEVSTFIEEGELLLSLNGNVMICGSGRAHTSLELNKVYQVFWMVVGKPEMTYTISISAPHSAQFYLSKVIGYKAFGFGMYHFKTK